MQDRYAGDVGDYVKLGLLRALGKGRQTGVVWYRFPDEDHNNDGRHVKYLSQPERYRYLDPDLYDHLRKVVVSARTVSSLLPTLPGAVSVGNSVDSGVVPARLRRDWRRTWFDRALREVSGCDIVFADPDNGIVDDADTRKRSAKYGKQIPLNEVQTLADGRCAVIYHHNTRRAGGHDAEVDHWLGNFGVPSMAVRATAYSPRTFFVLNPDHETVSRVVKFCERWGKMKVRLHTAHSN
ncbi:hypothetical protein O2N63_08960 [Aliiroseovarius sp. KMU-50]|uniref:Uncharacterized protein n=1 Tax=Aliiroseovarius salicola TaxID=3009082 RepID=A0ABT4W353_9RHOB|nr:hypothetical protein [Aliiroseovarius sp. KMU-50]MDA5094217.1 hypothetical protein [Aliiroseovarius sp. KMU-50]